VDVNFRKILPVLAVLVVIAGAAAFYWSRQTGGGPTAAGDTAEATPAPGGLLAVTADDMVMGDEKAPVTMIEYASLTCPHCAHFETETFPQIKQQYIDTGKVRFVYRDFPLDALALRASMLAHCAGKERYFGFVQVLFQQQASWDQAEDPEAALASIAKIGGIGKDEFDKCMADQTIEQRVIKTRHDAETGLDIESTPTFFINGQKVAGAKPIEVYQAVINPLLPKN